MKFRLYKEYMSASFVSTFHGHNIWKALISRGRYCVTIHVAVPIYGTWIMVVDHSSGISTAIPYSFDGSFGKMVSPWLGHLHRHWSSRSRVRHYAMKS